MRKIISCYLLSLLCVFLCSCKPKQLPASSSRLSKYQNSELKISLQYPSHWKPDTSLAFLGDNPSKYYSSDGFFAVNVLVNENQDLEEMAKAEANSGDYGQSPQIEKIIHNAKVGYFVYPSSDQDSSYDNRSCFITELRTIYRDNNINYDVLIIFADQENIKQLIDSLEYI